MPAEVAALGVFLCGDGAANISGGLLPIDGAWRRLNPDKRICSPSFPRRREPRRLSVWIPRLRGYDD